MKRNPSGINVPDYVPPSWVCLWYDAQGRVVMNEDREYLSMQYPVKGDKEVEEKMRKAAAYYGVNDGRPMWVPGRQITHSEWEDQMQRLQEGKIPDPVEEIMLKRNGR